MTDDDDYRGPPRWFPGFIILGVLTWVAVCFWIVLGLSGSPPPTQPDTMPLGEAGCPH